MLCRTIMNRLALPPTVLGVAWTLLVASAVFSAPAEAERLSPEKVKQLDSLLAARVGTGGAGCAIGVGLAGEAVYTRGAGGAVIEHGIAISPRTAFNLGSISKQFTAYVTLQLANEKRLSLDDDIRRYVPELPEYDAPIRILDLLHHTSGLRDYVGLARLGDRPVRSPERSMQEFLALMARQRSLNFTPGKAYAYVHSDYNMLGLVIERVTKQRLGDVFAERIWVPLGMTSTRQFDEMGSPIPGQALSYVSDERGVRTHFPVGALRGGTDIYSTAEDMLRWYAHLERPAAARRELVSDYLARPSLPSGEAMSYVHGIRQESYRGLPAVFRGGHGAYFSVDHITFPTLEVTTLALCNNQAIDSSELVRAMADVVLHDRFASAPETAPQTAAVPAVEIERLTGVYYDAETPWRQARIAPRDGELHVGSADGPETAPMQRLQENRYAVGGNVLDFIPDEAGGMQLRVTWPYGQGPLHAPRWDAPPNWVPGPSTLDEFTGTFFSEDVLHVVQIVRQGDTLFVRRSGRRDAPLVPVLPDVFSAEWRNGYPVGIAFVREGAHVIALEASDMSLNETVRRLRFDRLRVGTWREPRDD